MKEINELRRNLNNKVEYQLSEELLLSNREFVAEILSDEMELERLYKMK